jgi:hypothetical protein
MWDPSLGFLSNIFYNLLTILLLGGIIALIYFTLKSIPKIISDIPEAETSGQTKDAANKTPKAPNTINVNDRPFAVLSAFTLEEQQFLCGYFPEDEDREHTVLNCSNIKLEGRCYQTISNPTQWAKEDSITTLIDPNKPKAFPELPDSFNTLGEQETFVSKTQEQIDILLRKREAHELKNSEHKYGGTAKSLATAEACEYWANKINAIQFAAQNTPIRNID